MYERIQSMYLNKILEYNINLAIDESGAVKDSATKELQTIRRQINDQQGVLRARLESLVKIVSEKEANLKEQKISANSPIGNGLLGKAVGDVAEIKVPAGIIKFRIDKITA